MESLNKKQWNKDECSNLIELYRQHTNLWNSKSTDYKNRIKRQDSLKEIGNIFNCSGDEVDRKMKNLIGQYNRERRKYKNMKKSGAGQYFRSKWFAYNAMNFLHDKNKPRKGSQTGLNLETEDSDTSSDSSSNDTQSTTYDTQTTTYDTQTTTYDTPSATDDIEMTRYDENLEEESSGNLSQTPSKITQQEASASRDGQVTVEKRVNLFTIPKPTPKKTKASATNIRQEAFNMMKSVYDSRKPQTNSTRDEYDVFGELVGRKLRNLKTKYAQATVQHLINNILYDAEVGKYDAPRLCYYTSASTSSNTPSPRAVYTSCDSNNSNNETITNNLNPKDVPQSSEDSLLWAIITSFGLDQYNA